MSLKRFSQRAANLFPAPARHALVVLGFFVALAALAGLLLLLGPGPAPVTAAPAVTDRAPDLSDVTLAITGTQTTVSRTSGPNPSDYGVSLTFQATVKRVDTEATLTSGTVTFKDNGVNISDCVGKGLGSGHAQCKTDDLTGGEHTITAHYSGFGDFASSIGMLSPNQTVYKANPGLNLVCPESPNYGDEVECEATASGSPTPTGVVSFYDGDKDIGMDALDSDGKATATTSALTAGDHTIRAIYHGDDIYEADEAEDSLTVEKAIPDVTASGPSVSCYGESVEFKATVTSDVGTPTGKVVFTGWTNPFTATLYAGSEEVSFTTMEPLTATIITGITVEYKGDDNFQSETAVCPHVVVPVTTTTELQDPLPETDSGQDARFIISVKRNEDCPGSGTPSGNVTLYDLLPPVVITQTTLPEGKSVVTIITDTLTPGMHYLYASYSGGLPNFVDSTSTGITHTVNGAGSETSLESSVNPSACGQSVTFTATVEAAGAGSGTLGGHVTFKDDGTVISGCDSVSLPSPATCTTDALSAGEHEITAEYSGDSNFEPSEDSLRQTVNIIATTTALDGLVSSAVGDSVDFTATVSETLSGDLVDEGNVTFYDGTTELSTETLAAGKATCSTSFGSAGQHFLKAVYNGTESFQGSTSQRLKHTVGAVGTTTTLESSSNPSDYGDNVTFTATVKETDSGDAVTSGTVTFKDGATTLGSDTLDGSGQATLSTSDLTAGTHPIQAVYGGTADFAGSESMVLDQVVNEADTTTTITSHHPDSSVVGELVKVDFTVTGSTPTGNVTVTVSGDTTSCTGSVAAGTCTLIPTTAGAKTLTATYDGDDNFNGSSDTEGHTVNKAATTTTVTSSPNPSVLGQNVTITADVTADSPSTATPDEGTVDFSYNGTSLGSDSLANGSASVTTSSLPVGAHTITADYYGGANFNDSSDYSTHTVSETPADLSVTKTDSPDPVNVGDNLTYVINVTNNESESVDVTLTDTLPDEVTFDSAPGCTHSAGTVTCDLSLAANGGSASVTIVVTVPTTTPAGTVLSNTAEAGAHSDTEETTVYRSFTSGDCNGDYAVNVADVWSIVRHIFDPTFQGTSGCDANQDQRVDAGDVPSTVLIMLGNQEIGESGDREAADSLITEPGPALTMPDQVSAVPGGLATVPVSFAAHDHSITSLVFSVDYDETWLALDPADRDGNGIPDAVIFSLPGDFTASVDFDEGDADGEVDVFIGDISPPLTSLSDGPVVYMILDVASSPGGTQSAVRFSLDPAASFGDMSGQSVPGTATPMGRGPYQIYLPVLKR